MPPRFNCQSVKFDRQIDQLFLRKNATFDKNKSVFIYPVIFIILLIILLRFVKVFRIDGLSPWTIPFAFLVKFAVGILFNFIHEQTYGPGDLSHDGFTFMEEGKYLNDVFFQSPADFFKLLTGIGETDALIHKHLYMTEYWSYGDLSLVNDSKNVIRIHSLIHFISFGQSGIHLAIFCFISLLAAINLYLSFSDKIKLPQQVTFWVLLLIPSTIFWTSSVLKEPILFFGISLFVRGLIYDKQIWKKCINLVLSIFILIAFKPYILICILLALGGLMVYRNIFKLKLVPTTLLLLTLIFSFGYFFKKPIADATHFLSRKQFDFVNVGKGGLHVIADSSFYYFQPHQYENIEIKGNQVILLKPTDAYIAHFGSIQKPTPVHLEPTGETWDIHYFAPGCASFIETTPINDDPVQLIKNVPEALVNSILRPFPTDHGSNLKFLSVIEVWLIIFFIVFAIFNRRKLNDNEKSIIFTLILFALILSLLIGWTTPVLGAIARYRFPAQLATILVGLILLKHYNIRKWKNIFS